MTEKKREEKLFGDLLVKTTTSRLAADITVKNLKSKHQVHQVLWTEDSALFFNLRCEFNRRNFTGRLRNLWPV